MTNLIIMKIYYKVVNKCSGKLYSAIVHGNRGFNIRYFPGEWVQAKVGGLLVFTSKITATRFMSREEHHHGPMQLWECQCMHPVKLPKLRLWEIDDFIPSNLKKIWSKLFRQLKSDDLRTWPKNSKGFKKVKLLKQIA